MSVARLISVLDDDGGVVRTIPSTPGVYAIYDTAMRLQYVGMSRRLVTSVQGHVDALPDVAAFVKVCWVLHKIGTFFCYKLAREFPENWSACLLQTQYHTQLR
jgi:hypothetical protein